MRTKIKDMMLMMREELNSALCQGNFYDIFTCRAREEALLRKDPTRYLDRLLGNRSSLKSIDKGTVKQT